MREIARHDEARRRIWAPQLPWRLLTYVLALAAWGAFLPSIIPDRDSDRGIFVSVAERLLAGDRVYKDVLDNKEPLFYYFVASQRRAGAYGEIVGELLVLFVASFSVYKLSLHALGQNLSIATGFILAPFILTGQHYYPGYTELPGAALALLIIWSAAEQRWLLSGIWMGILIFAKILFIPLGVVSLAFFFFQRPAPGSMLRIMAGVSIASIVILSILAERGELGSFIENITLNVGYANNSVLIPASTLRDRVYLHLARVLDPGCIASYAAILVISLAGETKRLNDNAVFRSLSRLAFALALTSLMVLAATGLWDQHVQIVFVPAVISVVVLVGLLRQWLPADNDLAITMLAVIPSFALAGAPFNYEYVRRVREIGSNVALLDSLPPEAKYMREASRPTTYARLGENDDGAHAAGLRDWKLVCRKFHQYAFDDPAIFDEIEQCIPRANVVIVADSFRKYAGEGSPWDNFVDAANRIIDRQYECQVAPGLRVCRKRSTGQI
jgi:hypothetical protein